MHVSDFFNILEREIGPVALSDEFCAKYHMYDNSGIIYDSGLDVDKVLVSLDLSANSLRAATEMGAQCVLTHHPAIFRGLTKILPGEPVSDCIAGCVKNGISVISMHLNFDCAPYGIDHHLMRALRGRKEDALLNVVTGGGYGRVYDVKPVTFCEFVDGACSVLNTSRVMVYGDDDKKISRVASFCGAGGDGDAVAFAAAHGADAFVSADMKHHVISDLVQRGMCVLQLTHYSSESYGLGQITEKLKKTIKDCTISFYADSYML